MAKVYRSEEPPLAVAVDVVRSLVRERQVRLAFVGRAGAGKSTLASLIAQGDYPIINHADTMKEEVLEWVAEAVQVGFDPESEVSFERFADFMGISSSRIQNDFWEFIGPVFTSFSKLYVAVTRQRLEVSALASASLADKVQFVERHKPIFREPLQLYGQMSKEIAADEEYWVHRTIARSIGHPTCFNCDTRFVAEMECLKNCAWTGVYLWIDDATQEFRRPEMTDKERNHISEWSIGPEDCDLVIDATKPIPAILMNLADYLAEARVKMKEHAWR